MKVTGVELALNQTETRLLAAILVRAETKPERDFASELLDRIPMDLHPRRHP